jgi:uncharacterized membrane protein (DUF485 family)
MSKIKDFVGGSAYVKVDDKNRFYYMLQQMQSNRWKITMIVLFLFFFIVLGINAATFLEVSIQESWKEMLLILLGAFVGNLNKVVDYWFNSEDRDKMLIQKVDEEDGLSLSNLADPTQTPPPVKSVPVVSEPVLTEPVHVEEKETVEEKPASYRVEVDEDGDGESDGWDNDGDGIIDEYFPHRQCEHVWGDQDGDGIEECLICGKIKDSE